MAVVSLDEPLVYLIVWLGSLLVLWIFVASAVRNGVLAALRTHRKEVWREQARSRGQRQTPTVGREAFSVVDDTGPDEQ